MEVIRNQIKIRRRFRKEIGDLTDLIESISEIGLLHPIVINEKKELIAGLRRFKALTILKRKTIAVTVVNIANAMRGEFDENTIRKDFTMTENVAIFKEIQHEKSRGRPSKKGAKLAPFPKGKARDVAAKVGNISHGTMEKMVAIVDSKDKKLIAQVESKQTSVDYAFQQLQRIEDQKRPSPPLPKGQVDLIYLDPPWQYDLPLEGAPNYKTMSLDELKAMKIPAYKDCIMFMWATNPKLEDALELLKHWGFSYKTNLCWIKYDKKRDKMQITTGYYARGAHELLLIATKGSPGTPPESTRVASAILHPKSRKHSEKPEIFTKIIEKMYPRKTKLELFARVKRSGWKSWGDQIA